VVSDAEDDSDDGGGSIRWRRSNRWARVIDLPEVLAISDGRAFLLYAGIVSWCGGRVFSLVPRSCLSSSVRACRCCCRRPCLILLKERVTYDLPILGSLDLYFFSLAMRVNSRWIGSSVDIIMADQLDHPPGLAQQCQWSQTSTDGEA